MAPLNPDLLLPAALAVSLCGSLGGIVYEKKCASCTKSASLTGDVNLGIVGTAYYGVLFVLALFFAASATSAITVGVFAAAGLHLTLVALLARHKIVCVPCLVTAAGAFAGAVAIQAIHPVSWLMVFPGFATAVGMSYAALKLLRRRASTKWVRVARRVQGAVLRSEAPPEHGCARMLLYTQPWCPSCKQFIARVVEPLREELGDRFVVEERTPTADMAVPTALVMGRKNAVFVGNRPRAEVRQAVLLACGGEAERHGDAEMVARTVSSPVSEPQGAGVSG